MIEREQLTTCLGKSLQDMSKAIKRWTRTVEKYYCKYNLFTTVNCQVASRNEDLITTTGCMHAC